MRRIFPGLPAALPELTHVFQAGNRTRNLAAEVAKGLTGKLAQGGIPMCVPVGYLNVRCTDGQGREARTVEVDPERAPLIRWAFETSLRTRAARPMPTSSALGAPPRRPPARGSSCAGCGTAGRGLLRKHHDQRDRLPASRCRGGRGVRQARSGPQPGLHRPHREPGASKSRATSSWSRTSPTPSTYRRSSVTKAASVLGWPTSSTASPGTTNNTPEVARSSTTACGS